jgi:hypothetical protein
MKTTINRIKTINFTKQEQGVLKDINLEPLEQILLTDTHQKKLIDILIDINPDNQEHKDFIMEFIKELKR